MILPCFSDIYHGNTKLYEYANQLIIEFLDKYKLWWHIYKTKILQFKY